MTLWGLTTISTNRHWLHNANVKFVGLQLGNDSKTSKMIESANIYTYI